MPGQSCPDLITLEDPKPPSLPNLLDGDSEDEEDRQLANNRLRAAAPAFKPKSPPPKHEPAPSSHDEGILINLADGSALVLRPAESARNRTPYAIQVKPPVKPCPPSHWAPAPVSAKPRIRPYVPFPPPKVSQPGDKLDRKLNFSAHFKEFFPPSPPASPRYEPTPELTPPSSSSTRFPSPFPLSPAVESDIPIILCTPKEVSELFRYDGVAHPIPDCYRYRESHGPAKKAKHDVLLYFGDEDPSELLGEVDARIRTDDGIEDQEQYLARLVDCSEEQFVRSGGYGKLVELEEEEMIAEVDETLVDNVSRSSISDEQPYKISAAGQDGLDVENLMNFVSSERSTPPTSLSPTSLFDPYKHVPVEVTPPSYGLKSQLLGSKSQSPYELYSSLPSPRLYIPTHLLKPVRSDALQTSVMQSWANTEPTQDTKEFLARFLEQLSVAINARFGHPKEVTNKGSRRFEVDLFGSVSWGGTTGTGGDVDMVLLDKALPHGYAPSVWQIPPGQMPPQVSTTPHERVRHFNTALPRAYHLWTLSDVLAQAGMADVQPILGASTPIVKFRDPTGERECDMNVNDLGGWYNSSLILHYCLISPHLLRPFIHALKLWASVQDLNDPSGARGSSTMSSYCLVLMAIGYLQYRGCLPNLQADVNVSIPDVQEDTTDPDVVWVGWGKEQGVRAHVGFSKSPPVGWTSREPDLTVGDALRGFFSYFNQPPKDPATDLSTERYEYSTSLVSILNGGVATRANPIGQEMKKEVTSRTEMIGQGLEIELVHQTIAKARQKRFDEEAYMGKGDRGIQPRSWGDRKIVVQDPFLWQKNCAGQMSGKGVERFGAAINEAHRVLTQGGVNATLQDILHNPNPSIVSNPTRGRGRRGGPSTGSPGRGRLSPNFARGRGSPDMTRGRASPVYQVRGRGTSPVDLMRGRGSPVQRQLWTP